MSTEKKSLDVSKTEEDEDQDKVVDNVENAEGGKAKKNKKRKKKKASKEQQAEPEVKPVSCEWVSPCELGLISVGRGSFGGRIPVCV